MRGERQKISKRTLMIFGGFVLVLILVTLALIASSRQSEPETGTSAEPTVSPFSQQDLDDLAAASAQVTQASGKVQTLTNQFALATSGKTTLTDDELASLRQSLIEAQDELALAQSELETLQLRLGIEIVPTDIPTPTPTFVVPSVSPTPTPGDVRVDQVTISNLTRTVFLNKSGFMLIGVFDYLLFGEPKGPECVEAFKSEFPNMSVVGYSRLGSEADMRAAGVDAWLHKDEKNNRKRHPELMSWIANRVGSFDGLVIIFLLEDNSVKSILDEMADEPFRENAIIFSKSTCPDWKAADLPYPPTGEYIETF